MHVDESRIRPLNTYPVQTGPVVYWMSRDQRVDDNWALLYAQEKALERKEALVVVFCLLKSFLHAGNRQYNFMLAGLREVAEKLRKKNIQFFVLSGDPVKEIPLFITRSGVGLLITDFSPLKLSRSWKNHIVKHISIPCEEVDTHNIVPCWMASTKQEFGAYTLRPKLDKLLPDYLREIPPVRIHPISLKTSLPTHWELLRSVSADYAWKPGEIAGEAAMRNFLKLKLNRYNTDRNNPAISGQSDLSVYFHFGQLSAQRVALAVSHSITDPESKSAYLEELIVRKELSENYCFYNSEYDSVTTIPDWAKKTLNDHRKDQRSYIYSFTEFEQGRTHDNLWNAAQRQMVISGKMHGYLRMYWAKKILEWSESPEIAMKIAITLNDTYELDGRDPNGYAGIAWAICGVHDRPWPERSVFGKIRYMNYSGCKRKFNVNAYIENISMLENKQT